MLTQQPEQLERPTRGLQGLRGKDSVSLTPAAAHKPPSRDHAALEGTGCARIFVQLTLMGSQPLHPKGALHAAHDHEKMTSSNYLTFHIYEDCQNSRLMTQGYLSRKIRPP